MKKNTKRSRILRVGILPAMIFCAMLILEPAGVLLPSLFAATLHECGHLIAAAILGIPLRSLDIGPLGATLRVRGSLISYRKEWVLCAAGPGANFISAVFVYGICDHIGRFSKSAEWFVAVSVMLGLLNLIPAEGFDGGRMLSATVSSFAGPRVAARILSAASFISIVAMWMLSVYLLICHGTSLSLFVFTASLFYRLFIERDRQKT